MDIDVTSACSAKWRSEYRSEYKDHRSANTGGRRAAHWHRVAEQRTAALVEREKAERRKRGQPIPDGWPSYAIKFTHREGGDSRLASGGAQQQQQPMVSVLREMRSRTDLFVPISAIQRPVKIAQSAAQPTDAPATQSVEKPH